LHQRLERLSRSQTVDTAKKGYDCFKEKWHPKNPNEALSCGSSGSQRLGLAQLILFWLSRSELSQAKPSQAMTALGWENY
jgi:hypothetical protein